MKYLCIFSEEYIERFWIGKMSTAQEMFSHSIQLLQNKEYNTARNILSTLNESIAHSDQILALLATAEFELGEFAKAREHAEQALFINPNSTEAMHVNAAYHYQRGDRLVAMECYEKIIQLDSANISAWKQLINLLIAEKLFPKALLLLPRILSLPRHDNELNTLISIVYYNVESYNDSSRLLLEVYNQGVVDQRIITYLLLSLAKGNNELQFKRVARDLMQSQNARWIEIAIIALDEAQCYKEAISIFHLLIERKHAFSALLLNTFGLLFKKVDDQRKAVECLKAAHSLEPFNELYAVNLSLLYIDLDEIEKAITLLDELARGGAQSPDIYGNLGALLNRVGRLRESEAIILKGLSLSKNSENPTLFYNLGNSYMSMGEVEKSATQFKRAIELDPLYHAAYINLSSILTKQGYLVEAENVLYRYRDLKGETKEFLNNLGCLRREQMKLEDAIYLLRRSVDSDFENHEVHKNLSFSLLLTGDFSEGFEEYEWRRKNQDFLKLDGTEWSGTIEPGKRLLVHSEQGIGDDFQFLRFLKHIKNKGMTLIGLIRDELVDFIRNRDFFDEVYPLTSINVNQLKFDYFIPIGSLPYKLKLFDPSNYVADIPYVYAEPLGLPARKNKFSGGLVWSGNPKHSNDANRSIPINELAPLFDNAEIFWWNLQKGKYEEQIFAAYPHVAIRPVNREIKTWEDTARVLTELDCIVTVDTSVAHLAGAMGKKVLLLISYSPDWRWGLPNKEVKWYPGVELLRQQNYREWNAVIANASERLKILAKSR